MNLWTSLWDLLNPCTRCTPLKNTLFLVVDYAIDCVNPKPDYGDYSKKHDYAEMTWQKPNTADNHYAPLKATRSRGIHMLDCLTGTGEPYSWDHGGCGTGWVVAQSSLVEFLYSGLWVRGHVHGCLYYWYWLLFYDLAKFEQFCENSNSQHSYKRLNW